MVCGDGFLHGVWRWLHLEDPQVLGQGVVYAFIWHVILGVRMVSFFYVMVYS